MSTIYDHLMSKAQDAVTGGREAWECQSTGERLAVAMVLNRADWLGSMGYTLAQAVERIGLAWLEQVPAVAAAIGQEESPTQQIGRMLSATFTPEDLANMVHPHQPVIDLEVAIEKVGSEIAKASERYWNEARSPAPDEAVMVETLADTARLRTLQESLSLDDVEKVQAVLRGEIPSLLEELQPGHMTEIITFVKKSLEG